MKTHGENEEVTTSVKKIKILTLWERFASMVSQGLSQQFYKLGYTVASYPWTTIGLSWCVFFLTLLGFLRFDYEAQLIKTLIPPNSKFANDTKWFLDSFDEVVRQETVIIRADNVLVPSVLEKVALITDELVKATAIDQDAQTVRWENVCLKIPILIFYTQEDDDEEEDDEVEDHNLTTTTTSPIATTKYRPFNPSVDWNSTYFCGLVSKLPLACVQENIIDLWRYNLPVIRNLTQEKILRRINKDLRSPVTGHETNYHSLLGGIKRDQAGRIVGATSLMINFLTHVNVSEVDNNRILRTKVGMDTNWITDSVFLWEGVFNAKMAELVQRYSDRETKIFYSAARSTSDTNVDQMYTATNRMMIGNLVMFVFLQLVLSRLTWLEIRLVVGITGLVCVMMALITGYGLASGLGFMLTHTHSSIPFLVMGLGVDDMFVIMAGIKKQKQKQPDRPLVEQIAMTMKNAGTSITITSLTDILVFIVGISTQIPFLKSYCVYAALTIFMVYAFVVTLFVAVLTLDERRIRERKNAILPCIVHSEDAVEPVIHFNWLEHIVEFVYSKCVLTNLGKLLVITTTIMLTGTSLDSVFKLRQHFDETWFIPQDSYHHAFLMAKQELYPGLGAKSFIILRNVNYTEEFGKVLNLSERIEHSTSILYDTQSWVSPFQNFVWTYHDKDLRVDKLTDGEWRQYLSQFLFSNDGGKYQANFRFDGRLQCGHPVPDIKISTLDFKFRNFVEREDYLPVKRTIEATVQQANFTSPESTVWSQVFIMWILNSVIDAEIYRNIAMGLLAVMLCTAILIVNFQMCFWILLCILLSLINIGGFMQMWGLSLDIITCIALQMSVGLCVDYAAHIGHTFLNMPGESKNERAVKTVTYIGPAVIYGGSSTVLVFSALGTVASYGYLAFFRIFVLVVIFGLFHGLVLLPVILSLVGPDPYVERKKPLADGDRIFKFFTIFPKETYSTKL